MKLDTEFRKLPLYFDVHRLSTELGQFREADWRKHPQGYKGNSAIALIAVNGDPRNDDVKGPMHPTPFLERCPYIGQALGSLQAVLGRCRLMRIEGNGEASAHVDTNYYWLQRARVHVPIVTFPEVQFVCGGRSIHMARGDCWIFDTWRLHNVLNPNAHDRIHLVADTVGSAAFWELAARAERPFGEESADKEPARFVPYVPGARPTLTTEQVNFPIVMSPWEQECLIVRILDDFAESHDSNAAGLEALLESFHRQWRGLWARYGDTTAGWDAFAREIEQFEHALRPFEKRLFLSNGLEAVDVLRQAILRPALNPDLASSASLRVSVPHSPRQPARAPVFDRPIFIVSAPRSGSTLLFETLACSPSVWTVGDESHEVFERIPRLNPARRGYDSNRLTDVDADAPTAALIRDNFLGLLRDRAGQTLPNDVGNFRLLEKTPKNALRVPFLAETFPDARFIYLYRDPAENVSSILEAWKSGGFVTYPDLPGWRDLPWSMLLIPGWRHLIGKGVAQIAAEQWAVANRTIMDDLEHVPGEHWTAISYSELISRPQQIVESLCRFADIGWDKPLLAGTLPLSRYTLTPPDPDKWRKNAADLEPFLPYLEPIARRAVHFLTRY